ncbi:phage major capsid protein [Nocardia cyriacigeorgica]|uniref:phage major capsid protein n=1 Tax=Nocardia cyriacigeorgica TaxID=135487 RepID=UPI0018959340|nr:phage major capsid protein [Nocardia cyriacigeorgica]MBF6101442.1 phage major capsid protein [Nocardia cyriacigeorgica]MBF6162164.1 phage major capsid protein [Nocardia cyriacigeorgica]MBF6200774.1 phage major capsid protein [Nocardia cyriacigeorgica]MBF6518035.1 phage major capsid protein [Nocardia cyriacigeorgica]
MAVLTTNTPSGWHPEPVYFAPQEVLPEAAILQASNVAGAVSGDAVSVRVPFVADDEAGFTAEGSEIPESDPDLAEALVHTAKITQLVRLSREQYSQNGTAEQLAASVSRALTRKADLAFLAQVPPTAPAVAPVAGLTQTAGIVDGGTVAGDLDALVDAIAALGMNEAHPSHIILAPDSWAELRKLKAATDSNVSLLGAGTSDAQAMLLGLPVIVANAMPSLSGLVLDRNAIVSAVGQIEVATSDQVYFTSDSVALRATWRTGHVVVRPDRIAEFTVTPAV